MLSFSHLVTVRPAWKHKTTFLPVCVFVCVCVSGCDESSEEDYLAWRRDGETSRIPDVH